MNSRSLLKGLKYLTYVKTTTITISTEDLQLNTEILIKG